MGYIDAEQLRELAEPMRRTSTASTCSTLIEHAGRVP